MNNSGYICIPGVPGQRAKARVVVRARLSLRRREQIGGRAAALQRRRRRLAVRALRRARAFQLTLSLVLLAPRRQLHNTTPLDNLTKIDELQISCSNG